jgi:hypothetical protein
VVEKGWEAIRHGVTFVRDALRRDTPRPRARAVVMLSLALFGVALGVRLLCLQDNRHTMEVAHRYLYAQPRHYQAAARRILAQGFDAFVDDPYSERGAARMLVHPPGYALFVAGVFVIVDATPDALRVTQLVVDALLVVVLFLLALEVVPIGAAASGAAVVALSPHFAFNALVLQPDSVAVFPLACAMLALVRAAQSGRLSLVALAGVLVGVSCLVRANALLLAPVLAVALVPLAFDPGRRLRASVVLVAATLVTISPVTIRNWALYGELIPLSLGSGITLVEGIADYDAEGRFGLPSEDKQVAIAEARWYGRPDYATGIWSPDGIARDRLRFRRGARVVAENPVWFAGVMARRAATMVRYNDDRTLGWPADTSRAPALEAAPAFAHDPDLAGLAPVWTGGRAAVFSDAEVTEVAAGTRDSTPIEVASNADYVVRVAIRTVGGTGTVQVVDERGEVLAHTPVTKRMRIRAEDPERDRRRGASEMTELEMPFASRNARAVRLRLACDASSARPLAVSIGDVAFFALGPTPAPWLRAPRTAVRAVQKRLYTTDRMRALIAAGVVLLLVAGRRRAAAVLLAVPAYYLVFQSALHTEYRYTLPIHAFLLIVAGIALYVLALATVRAVARVRRAPARVGWSVGGEAVDSR